MPGYDELDFERLDYRRLSVEQRDALLRHVARRAQRERARALRALFGLLWSAPRRIALVLRHGAAVTAGWWRAHLERRQLRRAMAELHGFSDRELKDLGVRRSEIYWVVHHGRVETPPRVSSPPTAWSDSDPAMTARTTAPKKHPKETPVAA